jgi:hypothetical protein
VAVEADPNAVKVDSEGTATATESKTRLLRPVIAALVAAKSLDNDAGKQTAAGGGVPGAANSRQTLDSGAGGRGGYNGPGCRGSI